MWSAHVEKNRKLVFDKIHLPQDRVDGFVEANAAHLLETLTKLDRYITSAINKHTKRENHDLVAIRAHRRFSVIRMSKEVSSLHIVTEPVADETSARKDRLSNLSEDVTESRSRCLNEEVDSNLSRTYELDSVNEDYAYTRRPLDENRLWTDSGHISSGGRHASPSPHDHSGRRRLPRANIPADIDDGPAHGIEGLARDPPQRQTSTSNSHLMDLWESPPHSPSREGMRIHRRTVRRFGRLDQRKTLASDPNLIEYGDKPLIQDSDTAMLPISAGDGDDEWLFPSVHERVTGATAVDLVADKNEVQPSEDIDSATQVGWYEPDSWAVRHTIEFMPPSSSLTRFNDDASDRADKGSFESESGTLRGYEAEPESGTFGGDDFEPESEMFGDYKNKRTGRLPGPVQVDTEDGATTKRAKNTVAARESRQKKGDVEDSLQSTLSEMNTQGYYSMPTGSRSSAPNIHIIDDLSPYARSLGSAAKPDEPPVRFGGTTVTHSAGFANDFDRGEEETITGDAKGKGHAIKRANMSLRLGRNPWQCETESADDDDDDDAGEAEDGANRAALGALADTLIASLSQRWGQASAP